MLNAGPNQRKNGIVLVTVLFLTMLIAMFIGAAILVGPRTLGLAGSQDGELTAGMAAESGMQYALMRIRENPEWRGNGNGVVLAGEGITVVEDSGYVWGHLEAANGGASMFRIRFNFENGPDNGDNLDDSADLRFPTPYVSLNNLSNSNSAMVPRASSAQSTVDDPEAGDYVVPAHGICLIVEGLSGPGVRQFDPADPNPRGLVQTKILEGIYVVSNLGDIATDAVAMSNSNLVALVEEGKEFKVEAKAGVPRIRSRGQVDVKQQDGTDGLYTSKQGTVYTKDGTLQADYDSGKVTVETEKDSDPFYELTWDDLKQADPAGPKLSAGTYVWWDDGTLHYYDMNYDDYAQWVKLPANTGNPGQLIFSGGSYTGGFTPPASLEITEGKFTITGDLYVEPVNNATLGTQTTDLTVIPREGAPEEPGVAGGGGGGGALASGPALAAYLASNPAARTAFFAGRAGDGSSIGASVAAGDVGWDSAPATGSGADIAWTADGATVVFDTDDYSTLQEALEDAFSDGFVTQAELDTTAADYDLLSPEGDLNLGTGDTTTAEKLDVTFAPPKGESATLSAEGNIRIGAKLAGEGASVISGGTLKVIGAGANLAATPNAEEGVNMYARGDITLSTLKEKNDGSYEFKDIKLKGLVYTWGDFKAKLGSQDPDVKWGKMALEGTLVAYGGDPANGKPTNTSKGLVNITAEQIKLKFDPAYLLGVMKSLPDNVQFERASWTAYR